MKDKNRRLNQAKEVRELDATGETLGRLATRIAVLLQGKDRVDYAPNLVKGVQVLVKNSSQIKVTGKKLEQKKYHRHSGYLGNLKTETLGELLKRRPEEVLRRAVKGMLPKNRLRKIYLKNLIIQK
jgi:large subunit ribosomal protein L13